MKKFIALFLCVLFLFFSLPAVFAEGSVTPSLKLNPYGGAEEDIDTVSWFSASGNRRMLVVPADADLAAATLYVSGVSYNGEELQSGQNTVFLTDGEYTLTVGGSAVSFTILRAAEIPMVFLQTESGSLDYIHASKENKEPGSIRVYENGVITTDGALKQIKGRGNATWQSFAKKPYNIKFDKKTSLLGMPKAKKWTMLANMVDPASLHNPFGWCFAEK